MQETLEHQLRFPIDYHTRKIDLFFESSMSKFSILVFQNLVSHDYQHRRNHAGNRISVGWSAMRFSLHFSQEELKTYEHDYDLIIRQDFDETTYQVERFLQNQKQSYRKIREFILKELHSQSSSSSNDDGEVDSSSSDSGDSKSIAKKRLKSHS